MNSETGWERVLRKFGGQPPAWAQTAFSMWRDQPAEIFEEWLATANGSKVSIPTGAAPAGVWPVVCVPL